MDLNKKCVFILTGASRGIGKTLSVECCRRFKPNSLAILLARSKVELDETRRQILALNKNITVKVYCLDLGTALSKEYEDTLTDALNGGNVNDFERAFIVHNVGSVGDVSKTAKELSNVDGWKNYYHLNVFGVCALNGEFMKRFKEIPKLVVNITSKAAIVPFPSMTEYCCGKAAREMYFRGLASEENDTIVLNYSPGVVDTAMTVFVQKESNNEGVRESFRKSRVTRTMLTTEATTAKFLAVLEEHKFESGGRVDYYD